LFNPSAILITGASSGIGAALALELACQGRNLWLGGRDRSRLEAVAAQVRRRGAKAEMGVVDVTDALGVARWTAEAEAERPLELLIAAAGISGETGMPGDDPALGRRIYEVNVLGVLNTVEAVLPAMRRRRAGRVCIIASLAGLVGIPRGPAYSGSKAALIIQGQAWRAALRPHNVGVTVACPGYVRTPMTARHQSRLPFLMEAEDAARRIIDGIGADRGMVAFPWPLVIASRLLGLLPATYAGRFLPSAEALT
jgi:short-subunit dehydrogenase